MGGQRRGGLEDSEGREYRVGARVRRRRVRLVGVGAASVLGALRRLLGRETVVPLGVWRLWPVAVQPAIWQTRLDADVR